MTTNITGNQTTTQTWNFDADDYHATGNITIGTGGDITITGNANPFRFDGAYSFTVNTGKIVSNGTYAARKTWTANANPRAGAWGTWGFGNASIAAGSSVTFNIFRANQGWTFDHTGNTITFADNEQILSSSYGMIIGGAAAGTIAQSYARLRISKSANYSLYILTTNAQTLTDVDILSSGEGLITRFNAGGHTITRSRMLYGNHASSRAWYFLNAAGTITLDEFYGVQDAGFTVSLENGGTVTFSNSVVDRRGSYTSAGYYTVRKTAGTLNSSGNDLYGNHGNQALSAVTSDNDYLDGNNGGDEGQIDTDSGNTTSTSTPGQYTGLASNRTNARATPNKPLTSSSVASGSVTQSGATITWTSGIKSSSIVRYGTTSGVYTMTNAPQDDDWTGLEFGRTQHVTSHTVNLVNLKAGTTYYYQVGGHDPIGRAMTWSTEASFTVAAAGGGAARSMMCGAGGRVS